jgi:hypothetical protein
VDNTSRVHIFQSTLSKSASHIRFFQRFATNQYLIEEVLDELLLQRSGGEQAVEIGPEEFSNEVTGNVSRCM